MVSAQAWSYPAFQPPRVVARDFTAGLGHADRVGTSVVVQWREGIGPEHQLSFDAGIADPPGEGRNFILGGGQYAYQFARGPTAAPFDLLFTGGLYAAFGRSQSFFRIPLGVSAGRRFALANGVGVTPYVHPRITLERCTDCDVGHSHTDFGIHADIGVDLEITPSVALRGSALLGTTDRTFNEGNGFGFALTFTPAPLSGFRR